jgi:hypothetical protein
MERRGRGPARSVSGLWTGGRDSPEERVRLGAELNRVVNDFFASYLVHLN